MTRIDRIEENLEKLQELVHSQQMEINNLKQMLMDTDPANVSGTEYDGYVSLGSRMVDEADDTRVRLPWEEDFEQGEQSEQETQDELSPEERAFIRAREALQAGNNRRSMSQGADRRERQQDTAQEGENGRSGDARGDVGQRSRRSAAQAGRPVDMEHKLGHMMGIIASVMIFIGIILFVTTVYGSFPGPLKAACIFVFSFALLGVGVMWMRKNLNAFTMSLTGCGMGAIYLSLFITHLYFGYINQFVLYILITAWAAGVYYFFGKDYAAFKVIGQVGILISVFFGFVYIGVLDLSYGSEWMTMLFLMSFFMITSWFYLFVDRNKNSKTTITCVIMNEVAMLIFWMMWLFVGKDDVVMYRGRAIVYMLFMVINLLVFLWVYVTSGENKEDSIKGVWYLIILGLTGIMVYNIIGKSLYELPGVVVFAVAVVVLICLLMIELARKNKDGIHLFAIGVIYALLLWFTNVLGNESLNSFVWSIYGIVLLWAGYRFADRAAIYLSYGTLALAVLSMDEGILLWLTLIVCIVHAGMAGYYLYTKKDEYHVKLKLVLYPVIQIALFYIVGQALYELGFSEELSMAWGYIFSAGLSVAACQNFFNRSFDEDEEYESSTMNMTSAINGFLMTVGSVFIFQPYYNGVMKFILLIMVFAVYFINIMPLFERYGDTTATGIYNGLKLSIYALCVLKSYEMTGPVISITWIVLAILLIWGGFKFGYKYLRVYGLGLVMFSICKLLIFDIDYEVAMIRVISFILSGVLCFVINLIYNNADKR